VGSPAPIPGRCGAKSKRGDGYCVNRPVNGGAKRCRMHGGTREGDPSNALVHGRYSKHFRRISLEAQEEIDAALQDPDLLDVRQPIAIGRVLLNEARLIPSQEMAEAQAKRDISRSLAGMNFEGMPAETIEALLEATDADIEIARMTLITRSHKLVGDHHKRQVDALRQIEVGRLMRDVLVPMFGEMGLRLGRLVDEYIDDPVKREKFRAAYRAEAKQVVVHIADLRNGGSKRKP
jgi:hypothetical protein